MARGVAFLARREYSRDQLRRKLLDSLTPDETAQDVDATLDNLVRKGYLNDARYAEALCRLRGARYGNRRLVQELQEAGLDASTIQTALESAGGEFERARAVWARRFQWAPEDEKARVRQIRFLASRGFEYGVIADVLKQARSQDSET